MSEKKVLLSSQSDRFYFTVRIMQIISIIKSLKYIFIKIISNKRILMESGYSMHSEANGSVYGQSRHQKYCLRESGSVSRDPV